MDNIEQLEQMQPLARITFMGFEELSSEELLAEARRLAAIERKAAADLLACLAEIHRRHSALDAGYPSLFVFCVEGLRLSARSAYERVQAVEAANKRPEIYSGLRDGSLTLTAVCRIASHLEDHPDLIGRVAGKTTRQVETMLAELSPLPRAKPDSIKLVGIASSPPSAPEEPDLFAATPPSAPPQRTNPPTAPEIKGEIRFTASLDLVNALERLRALLWHKYPDGRLEFLLLEAVSDYLTRRDPARDRRRSRAHEPDPRSRKPPAAVARQVWIRDGARCAYVSADGQRCYETRSLEIDHVLPFALGGRSDDPTNLRLLCRAHNQTEAQRLFGADSTRPSKDDN